MIQLEVLSPSYKLSVGSSVPIGQRGLVHVWGKNDMPTSQYLGISWVVKDPTGLTVESYTDWTGWAPFYKKIDPDKTHEFIGGRFDINKPGSWTIEVVLFMNIEAPVMVASYSGVLCVVEQLLGTIVEKKLEYDETKGSIPVPRVPVGQEGLVHIRGQNNTPSEQELGISWIVRDPDGLLVEVYPENKDIEWSATGAGKDHEFIGGRFEFFKEGIYTIDVKLFMNPDDPVVVDSYEGALCTTTPEVPREYELIQETIYPYAYIYDGEVEVVTATFKTDPFTPSAWITEKFAEKLASEAKNNGGRVLEVRVYADTKPLFWTNIRIDIISTPLTETTGGAPRQTGLALWLTILIIALSIIAVIIALTIAFNIVMDRFEHKPISEKIKKTWSKPTLISAINDFEIELKLTPTPPSELEGMSDQELRDYCDMLAEEIAPPGVSWLPWAIAGGVGVLAVGTVAVLAGRKKKKEV